MRIRIGSSFVLAGVVGVVLCTVVTIQRSRAAALFLENRRCCQLSFTRNLQVTLEERGWSGVCIDPFPVHMEGRKCKILREVVFSKPGLIMPFHTAGGLGGVADTLGEWNEEAARAPTVNVTTTTLDQILARSGAPQFIHFMSLDIEGAELEALRAFPFDRYRVGAWTIEHNRQEPKRSQIVALLALHGYQRVNEWHQDDFFVPVDARY
jgi:FkbM family methyltransferase